VRYRRPRVVGDASTQHATRTGARNSGKDTNIWPYCQPGLEALYANATTCSQSAKDNASCNVPQSMRQYNGDYKCVKHALCGIGYCHDKLRA
jgi:hypothetical protein